MIDDIPRLGRLPAAAIQALLDRLDALEEQAKDKKRRKTPRYSYRVSNLYARITQPGGGTNECTVQSRNLSAMGVSFLYSGFLHTGTEISVRLKRFRGGDEIVHGHISWCRHLAGNLHSLGMKFKARVFPKLYVDPSIVGDAEQNDRVDPSTLQGSVLMLDDQMMDRLLFEHQMAATKIKTVTVGTVEQAMEQVAAQKFDIVISDLNLSEMTGEQAFKQIRSVGYKGVMIALTAETSPARIQGAQNAGASAIIRKPYDLDQLTATLAAFLSSGGVTADQLIHSALAKKPGFEPVLRQYVDSVRGLGVAMKTAIDEGQFDIVRAKVLAIKGSAAGFGFQQLTDAAKEAAKMLDLSRSVAEAMPHLEQLLQMCRRVTSDAG